MIWADLVLAVSLTVLVVRGHFQNTKRTWPLIHRVSNLQPEWASYNPNSACCAHISVSSQLSYDQPQTLFGTVVTVILVRPAQQNSPKRFSPEAPVRGSDTLLNRPLATLAPLPHKHDSRAGAEMRCQAVRMQTGAGATIAPPLVSLQASGHFLKVEDAMIFLTGGSGDNALQIRRSAALHGKGATLRGGHDRLDPCPLGPGAGHWQ